MAFMEELKSPKTMSHVSSIPSRCAPKGSGVWLDLALKGNVFCRQDRQIYAAHLLTNGTPMGGFSV
jgi:hypothetical protein